MEKSILHDIKKLILIQGEKKYDSLVKNLYKNNLTKEEKENICGEIITIINKSILKDDILNNDDSLKPKLDKLINNLGDITRGKKYSEVFTKYIETAYSEVNNILIQHYYLKYLKRLLSFCKNNNLNDIKDKFEYLNKSLSYSEILAFIINIINDIKLEVINKTDDKELVESISEIESRIIKNLKDKQFIDYDDLDRDLRDYLDISSNVLKSNVQSKLKRESKEGKISKLKNSKIAKKILCGGIAVSIFAAGLLIGRNNNSNNNSTEELDETKGEIENDIPESTITEKPELEQEVIISEMTDKVASNWDNYVSDYSKEDISELIKVANGMPSEYTINDLDTVIIDLINNVVNPIINGENIDSDTNLNISGLFLNKNENILKAEEYLNYLVNNYSNLSNEKIKEIYKYIITVAIAKDKVEDLQISENDVSTPIEELVWSRLALGITGLTSTVDVDYNITVDNEVYNSIDTCNWKIYDTIANNAIKEINGSKTK